MKRIINFLLSTLMVLTLVFGINFASITAANADTGEKMAYPNAPLFLNEVDDDYFGFELESESEHIALYVNDANINIAVLNKKTGFIWSSLVKEEDTGSAVYDARYYSLFYWRHLVASQPLNSPVVRYGADLKDDTLTTADYVDCYLSVDHSAVKNGIRVTGYDSRASNRIVLDFYLDTEKETLEVVLDTINFNNYNGRDNTRWVTVDVLPYFGAAKDTENGYIFYPDGSGTIAEFTPHHTNAESTKTLTFYSIEAPSVDLLNLREYEGIMPVLYPIFGIKRGNDGLFGVVTDCASSSGITFEPAGNVSNYNRIYPKFYTMEVSAVESNFDEASYYEGHILKQFYKVEYYFLDGDDADYAGMAKTYRNYLIKNDMMNDVIDDATKLPLALQLYMNGSEESVLGYKNETLTTYAQAKEIIEELKQNGVEDMLINIAWWQQNGADWGNNITSIPSASGGEGGLKSFTKTAMECGYDVFMNVTMEYAISSTKGFKASRDAAKDKQGLAVNGNWYLIAPNVIKDRYENLYRPFMSKLDISGMNYGQLGYFIYYYYYGGQKYLREDTVKLFQSILEQSRNDFGKNAVWYGNQYALKYSDWIFDLPIQDTGYANTTREVPFAQILLHGYIPYSAISGNSFYDDKKQTLKWIEYGYIPYYALTYENSDYFFSAQYDTWKDTMVEKYKLFYSEFGYLYNKTIVNHDMLNNDVFVTTYEDGSKIYVNYSEFDYKTKDGVVKAEDYLLVKG